jgi:hypothetical protein
MIERGHGNLLTAEVEALVNTVNTVGVMGKALPSSSSEPSRPTSAPTARLVLGARSGSVKSGPSTPV